jgi:WXG100 family type VII secretion target
MCPSLPASITTLDWKGVLGMAGDRYTTDTETMESTAARVEDAASNFSAEVKGLMNRLAGMAGDYVGGGGTAFQEVSARVDKLTAAAYYALAETAQAVRTSGRSYADADDEARLDMAAAGAGESEIAHALLAGSGGSGAASHSSAV